MPLIDRLLASRRKNIETNADCKLPVDIDTGLCIRNTLNFGADQIRILLFRECEWRGRKLLFDSITAGKNNGTNTSCPRSGNGLPHECEKEICNNVNLLSEMVFGTVAMTYRGTLFKIHTLEFPRCVICTKVFPAPDHNTRKKNGKFSDDTLGLLNINDNNDNNDSNSSSGSMRNTLSCPSSGNISGNSSLRKSSTCSSNCSGWDVEFPIFPITTCIGNSDKSLETNSNSTLSSGFGSFPSLRRRWLRSLSTSLNHTDISQMMEILGFQFYGDNNTLFSSPSSSISTCGNIFDPSSRRHKTRLGLTIMIKLTPEREKEMELRLFEHATQLEAILDRLCHVCINTDKERGLIERLHQASFRCTCWLLRLLVTKKKYSNNVSIWHEIILNKCISTDRKTTMLYRNFQQMCRVLDTVDTKSTNFFLSTLITAVLTYHLGWINTIITLKEKTLFENLETKYPCNPLWIQLSDLYGTLGNPSKRVHTIIAGDGDKSTLIDAVLTFLSYFIRSAIVKKHYMYRDTSGQDVREAISIIDKKQNKLLTSLSSFPFPAASSSSSSSSSCFSSIHPCFPCPPIRRLKKQPTTEPNKTLKKQFYLKKSDDYNIPKLKKTSSLHRNLNLEDLNCMKLEDKVALKLDSYQDDFHGPEKGVINTSLIKIVVESEKNTTKTVTLDQVEEKPELRNSQVLPIDSKTISSIFLQNDFHPIKEAVSMNTNGVDETEVYFSHIEYENNKRSQVFFTVGDEEKSLIDETSTIQTNGSCSCQCSFAFTRVPSTSAQLPAGVLRKILQRNFPESSKSIQRPGTSFSRDKSFGTYCPKCNGSNINGNYESSKLLLETPTNATEVLRTCGASTIGIRDGRNHQSDYLEQLLEVNNFIELPMPRTKNNPPDKTEDDFDETSGYINTLLQREIPKTNGQMVFTDVQYTAGLIIQGVMKKSNGNNRVKREIIEPIMDNWLSELRDDIIMTTKHPLLDNSISETLCIVADIDNWQVGIISNAIPINDSLLPVGMSRLVSRMLEAFVYLWTKHKSSLHCFNILESKMREIWLRSGALAQMIMTMNVCNINLSCLTSALDVDAADIPLLLAVATTHSPQILQRIGFTYN